MIENLRISSGQFWMSSLVAAFVDIIFLSFLVWRIKPASFRELKWTLVGAAAIFWGLFAILLVRVFWNSYYRFFFPGWFRSGGLLLYVPLLYAAFAWTFHWLACRLPGNPIVSFCLLGGAESLLEHLLGIYILNILAVPILQEASPASILAFSFPEYGLYWCMVISIAALFQWGWRGWVNLRRSRLKAA